MAAAFEQGERLKSFEGGEFEPLLVEAGPREGNVVGKAGDGFPAQQRLERAAFPDEMGRGRDPESFRRPHASALRHQALGLRDNA